MVNQEEIFNSSEGDEWFLRNEPRLDLKGDLPLKLIEMYGLKPKRTIEIGASNGYRLNALGGDLYAVDPSEKAIADGRKKYPQIHFEKATISDMKTSGKFDLVIIYSVLHWVDRENLLDNIAKIDKLVGEYLILGDFQTPIPFKRKYKHHEGVYTYKLDCKKIFLATGMYKEIATICKEDANLANYVSTSLLKKEDLYQIQEDV